MNRPVNIVALMRTPETQEAFRRAVSRDSGNLQIMVMPLQLDLAALRALRGDIIVIDIDVTSPTEMRVLGEFIADESSPPVVVTAAQLDVAAMRTIMRLGLSDVVPQPFDRGDLGMAMQAALARRRTGASYGKQGALVSFVGCSGGVGTTSLAVHGACAMARGKDASDLCLIDLCLQFGTAALLMDAEQKLSILDLVRDPRRLDGALLRGNMVRVKDRFDLLPAPAQVCSMELDPVALAATLSVARSQYSTVFVDLPQLWSQWTYAVLQMSSAIVLVVQLGVPSLKLARRQIDWLNREGLDQVPLIVVANRVESGLFKKQLSLADAAKALGRKVDHTIANEPAFQLAADLGLPVGTASGGGSVEKKLGAMMKDILRYAQPAIANKGI